MNESRTQVSPHQLIDELTKLTSRGVIAGFARDTYPDGDGIRWIISGRGPSSVLYLDTVECRAYVRGANQALQALEAK